MNVPTGYTALDLVGFTDRGNYDPSVYYVQNDLTHSAGNIWRCLIDDTHGITPTEGANWTIFVSEPSNMTEAIIAPIEVSPATAAHSVGDQLIYNDVLYKVISAIAIGDSLTVGTNIEVARKIVYQISGLESDIATIEPTSTASKNYAVGEYMFYGWEFYRVTTAITAGDTIVTTGAGQNVEEVTVGGELTALKSDAAKNTALYGQTLETIGATAINNHTIGDYFLATDGKTYRCIAAITGGSSTITLNTNCVEQPIADVLSPERFNLIKINNGDTIDDATSCVKIGNICIISGAVTLATASSNQITSICKMPLEYKPSVNHCPIFVCDSTNRIPNEGQVVFSATECYIRSFRQSGSTPSATDFSFMAVYLCA